MRHIALGGLAALVAAAITISLHFFGAHDIEGFIAAVAGYPGLLANGEYTSLNEVLFTAVNWLFYFLLFEGAMALRRKFLR
jgi:hypothetical protein